MLLPLPQYASMAWYSLKAQDIPPSYGEKERDDTK